MIFPTIQSSYNEPFSWPKLEPKDFLIIIFYRGIWCNSCKKQLKEFNDALAEIKSKNGQLIAVSSDRPFESSLLKNFLRLSFPVLSDPKLELIKKLNLQTKEKDKEISKPAVFVFNYKGKVIYSYIGKDHEDRPDLKVVLSSF